MESLKVFHRCRLVPPPVTPPCMAIAQFACTAFSVAGSMYSKEATRSVPSCDLLM